MEAAIREAQKAVLKIFSGIKTNFALAGGTALELYYLHHRYSSDLDFFSPKFKDSDIKKIVAELGREINKGIRFESELTREGMARVRFYSLPVREAERVLKIDFVEDVFLKKPKIKNFGKVPVYSAEDIYFLKIIALAGSGAVIDSTGRWRMEGRQKARDVFDVYMLSKKIKPLHLFLKNIPSPWQRGMIHWYRTFSRHEFQLALLDMEIYDRQVDSRKIILYLEHEIKLFTKELLK